MNNALMELADIYFKDVHGVSLKDLLAPIAEQSPAGEARRQDDAALSVGRLAHELEHADWPVVTKAATHHSSRRSAAHYQVS